MMSQSSSSAFAASSSSIPAISALPLLNSLANNFIYEQANSSPKFDKDSCNNSAYLDNISENNRNISKTISSNSDNSICSVSSSSCANETIECEIQPSQFNFNVLSASSSNSDFENCRLRLKQSKEEKLSQKDNNKNMKTLMDSFLNQKQLKQLSSSSEMEKESDSFPIIYPYYYPQYRYYSQDQQAQESPCLFTKDNTSSTSCSTEFSFSGWHRNRFNFNRHHHNNHNNNNNINNHQSCNNKGQINNNLREQQINASCCCSIVEIENSQSQLRSIISQILSSSPIVGLYKNETVDEWQQFVSGLIQYFENKENGARAKAAAQLRAAAQTQEGAELRDLINSLGINIDECNIKEINRKCDNLVATSPIKRELETSIAQQKKMQQGVAELQQEDSKVRNGIISGLQKKYSKIEVETRIRKIIEDRIKELLIIQQRIERIKEELNSDERVRRVKRIRQLLGENLMESEKQLGRDTQNSGNTFEEEIASNANNCLKVLLTRIGKTQDDVNVFRGVQWENTDGEVDIVITDKNSKQILAIAEAKARVYDIAAAFRQSGAARSSSKKRLLINGIPLEADKFLTPFFVITTLPKNKLSLPFESKLKDSLNKYFASQEPEDVNYQEVYESLCPLYSNMQSPLKWFEEYADDILIVADEKETQLQGCTTDRTTCCSCRTHCKNNIYELSKTNSYIQDTDTDTNDDYDRDSDDSRDHETSHLKNLQWQTLSSQESSVQVTEEDEENQPIETILEDEETEKEEEHREREKEREQRMEMHTKLIENRFESIARNNLPIKQINETELLQSEQQMHLYHKSMPHPQPQPHPHPQQQQQLHNKYSELNFKQKKQNKIEQKQQQRQLKQQQSEIKQLTSIQDSLQVQEQKQNKTQQLQLLLQLQPQLLLESPLNQQQQLRLKEKLLVGGLHGLSLGSLGLSLGSLQLSLGSKSLGGNPQELFEQTQISNSSCDENSVVIEQVSLVEGYQVDVEVEVVVVRNETSSSKSKGKGKGSRKSKSGSMPSKKQQQLRKPNVDNILEASESEVSSRQLKISEEVLLDRLPFQIPPQNSLTQQQC